MSQKELSDLLHIDQTNLSKLEKGMVKNPRKLDALAVALRVPELWLRFGIEALDELKDENVKAAFLLDKLPPEDQQVVRDLIQRLSSE